MHLAIRRCTPGESRDAAYARLLGLTNIALVNDPGTSAKETPLWQKMLQRERLLSAAWREAIGHTKPNKSKALPLDDAKQEAAKLEKEIRATLNSLMQQPITPKIE